MNMRVEQWASERPRYLDNILHTVEQECPELTFTVILVSNSSFASLQDLYSAILCQRHAILPSSEYKTLRKFDLIPGPKVFALLKRACGPARM